MGGFIVHNWPLKMAAIILAALLYVGLVATQDSNTTAGPIAITPVNQPSDTVITNQLRDVEQIRYIAPADLGRLRTDDFRATVDLTNVTPDGNPVNLRVIVTATDPRVMILEVRPRTIQVVLDQSASKTMAVTVVEAPPPPGLEVGDITITPSEVTISGPSAAVNRVTMLRVNVPIDASGLDVDRDFGPDALDAAGQVVTGIELNPADVHVNLPVYTNKETRTVPVNPIVTGTPGAGFRVSAIAVSPSVISVMGDADQLAALVSADTAPVAVSGATRNITADVALALPSGVAGVGVVTVTVTVTIEPVTETRSFVAGIRLDGMRDGFLYDLSDLHVTLTLFGSTADLDTIGAAPLVVAINVSALDPG
ncbi:MAG: CdaR family protein, partial [Chloroflexota bacterium]